MRMLNMYIKQLYIWETVIDELSQFSIMLFDVQVIMHIVYCLLIILHSEK